MFDSVVSGLDLATITQVLDLVVAALALYVAVRLLQLLQRGALD